MSREDQYAVNVNLDSVNLGTFDRMSGGEMDSEETKHNPGGMGLQISLGGRRNVGNVTVGKLTNLDSDHPQFGKWMNRCGKGALVITKQPLDEDGNAKGKALIYSGKLKSVTPPDHDSESSDKGYFSFEMSSATVSQ